MEGSAVLPLNIEKPMPEGNLTIVAKPHPYGSDVVCAMA